MTATAMLELKQRVSRLTKSEQRELSAHMNRTRRQPTRRKPSKLKMQRDPITGLPFFAPLRGASPLTLATVKQVLSDFP
jgi:hypothetical protein